MLDTTMDGKLSSRPSRARGLKRTAPLGGWRLRVAPVTGAWIETA